MTHPAEPSPTPERPGDAEGPRPGEATTWATGDGTRTGAFYPPSQTHPMPQATPPVWGAPGRPDGPGAYSSPGAAFASSPSPNGDQPPAPPHRASSSRAALGRYLPLLLVALLAAALASGGTWALTRGTAQPTVNEGTRTVEQADPNSPNWTTTARVVGPSVVSIRVESDSARGEGSGVILDTKGHVVTNNHVAAGAGSRAQITVALDDKRAYDATVVGADPATDLAVLQLKNPPSDLKPIALGDDTKLKVGDPVMAVGNPLGLSGTVTTGIVSALNRPVPTQQEGSTGSTSDTAVVTNAIQTSAAINPGNSGGALVNASGQLVGINSSIASLSSSSQSGGNIGIGFAIPVNEVKNVTDQLIATGKARHAQLGVQVKDAVVADGNDRRAAAGIAGIVADGPADKAGIKTGDAVVSVDGEIVDSALALQAQIRERKVGDQVTLVLVRSGARQEIKVTLGERS